MAWVVVGRLENSKRIEVDEGTSVLEALEEAGFEKADDETIKNAAGDEFDGDESVVNGKSYYLFHRVKSGSQ